MENIYEDPLPECSFTISGKNVPVQQEKDTLIAVENVELNEPAIELPCKPEKPSDSDCCGSGCIPCVFDIYDQEIKIWERECARLRNKAVPGEDDLFKEKSMLSELEYRKFTISKVWPETGDTNRYRFKLPFDRDLGLKIGQHIIVRGRSLNETITRQYTPITDITTSGYFDLLIKIYRDGKMSKIISHWKVGDEVEIRGPFGSLEYVPGKYRYILMLAAGTGIAPMSQVVQGILNNEEDETFIHLLYGCHTYKDILMKKELDEWAGYWNFSVTYALSQEQGKNYQYGDKVCERRIDETSIHQEISGKTMDKIMILICGTRSFDEDIMKCCENLGFNQKQIFKF